MTEHAETDFFETAPLQRGSSEQMHSDYDVIRARLRALLKHSPDLTRSYRDEDLAGVLAYLADGTLHHSEGRDLSVDKRNYAITELYKADAFSNDADTVRYLFYRYQFNHYPRHHIVSEFPTVLCIEPTSICNLRCIMCFQCDEVFTGNPTNMGMMSLDLFRHIIDQAVPHGLHSIVLASRGEPLLNKNIYAMIRYAKENGVLDIKLNTNATVLNEKNTHRILEAGVDTLVFSVDSADKEQFEQIRVGADFDKIVTNIKRFKEIRDREYPDAKLRTRVTMVQVSDEIDIAKASAFWEPLVDEFGCRGLIERLDIYDRPKLERDRACSLLWERLYVWFDGKVNVCDEDYRSTLSPGSIDTQSIHDIWHGPEMQALRLGHIKDRRSCPAPCDSCPGF